MKKHIKWINFKDFKNFFEIFSFPKIHIFFLCRPITRSVAKFSWAFNTQPVRQLLCLLFRDNNLGPFQLRKGALYAIRLQFNSRLFLKSNYEE